MDVRTGFLCLLALLGAAAKPSANTAARELPGGRPAATVDLATHAGVELVRAEWRYADATVTTVAFRAPGPDRKPSGAPNETFDVVPHAGAADFDDSAWEVLDPTTLDARRGTGRICFGWYRIALSVPERVGAFDTAGSTLVFETVVDDYAEVWVDGELPRELGQSGGSLVKGWNAPNRLVIGTDVAPGQRIQLAVFGINGPLSDPPPNFVWMRSAKLEFHRPDPVAFAARPVETRIARLSPALDAIVAPGAQAELLASGFVFTEGPVWVPEGYLLFSDPNENRIWRWEAPDELSVFRERSGYDGPDLAEYGQPGSNGLALDPHGRLTVCEHGNRRVTRLDLGGEPVVLADRYEGRRLNSPNDLVYRSDGVLYFTDPPFGLPGFHDDPRRELPVTGVFRLRGGELALVSDALTGPNGVALSPNERFLYVTNWDPERKVVMRYEVQPDGTLAAGRVFFDMGAASEPEALDGIEVDERGDLFVSGPGGVWILSPAGEELGRLVLPELPANFAWGGDDGRTLFMTARSGLYRLRLLVGAPRRAPAPG